MNNNGNLQEIVGSYKDTDSENCRICEEEDVWNEAEELVDACDDLEIDGYVQFVRDMQQYPLLTKAQEVEKFQALYNAAPGSREHWKIREEIFNSNLRLIIKVVSSEFRNHTTTVMSFQDMIQEGTIGLNKALCKFDITQGYKFSTYATHWIRQSIQRAIADHGMNYRLTPNKYAKIKRVMAIRNRMEDELGRFPTTKELAAESGLREAEVDELVSIAIPTYSVDRVLNPESRGVSGESEMTLGTIIADETSSHIEDDITRKLERQRILDIAKKCLNPTAYSVFVARHLYDKPESFESIGARLGFSREYIRQMDVKAINAIRYIYQNGHVPPPQKVSNTTDMTY